MKLFPLGTRGKINTHPMPQSITKSHFYNDGVTLWTLTTPLRLTQIACDPLMARCCRSLSSFSQSVHYAKNMLPHLIPKKVAFYTCWDLAWILPSLWARPRSGMSCYSTMSPSSSYWAWYSRTWPYAGLKRKRNVIRNVSYLTQSCF